MWLLIPSGRYDGYTDGEVSAIEAVRVQFAQSGREGPSRTYSVVVLAATAVLFALVALAVPAQAFSGRAASGELLFYPCSNCHALPPDAADRSLPGDFEGHQVELIGHDALGEGTQACFVCHDGPGRDPSVLNVLGGQTVRVGADTSRVCWGCHANVYEEWTVGIHGRGQPSCSAAGCHDPHSPAWIYAAPLPPFTGTGFETRVVSERTTFTPLAGYPVKAPVETPAWLIAAAALGLAASGACIAFMLSGRSAR